MMCSLLSIEASFSFKSFKFYFKYLFGLQLAVVWVINNVPIRNFNLGCHPFGDMLRD